jgi:Tfp pilus assembly protein PilX
MTSRPAPARRGSALITVIFLTAMFALLTASMLRYTMQEKRFNERNRLQLRAKNMAENISVYAAEQLTTKLYRTRATSAMAFMTGSNAIALPDSSGNASVLSNVKFATVSGMEVRAGMLAPTAYALVTDASDSNYGLQVSTATVPIIAKATVTHPTLGAQTAHVLQEMEISMTPLFQFGLFYNMDLELFPGQTMTIMGPVHTNGRLMARGEVGGTAVLTFSDRVSAANGLYADGQMKVAYRNRSGANTAGAGGSGAVNYTRINNTQLNLYSGTIWRDHRWGNASESATTLNNFRTFTTTNYGSNVRTNVHGVTKLELPGIGSYNETNLSTTPEDDRNNGRQIIEPPNPRKWNATTSAWEDTTDTADARESKISWKAGLYLAVNPDDSVRFAKLPNGTEQPVMPHSYRAWVTSANSSGTITCTEVVLPGQPTYGYARNGTPLDLSDDYAYINTLPNRYTEGTAIGANQLLRIPQAVFTRGSGYLVNGAHVLGATTVAVDTGTGTIEPGDIVSIGSFRYLVAGRLNGGTITLAAPGLRAAVADNAAIALNALNQRGSVTSLLTAGAVALGATAFAVDGNASAANTLWPGDSVTIGSWRYLVTAAPITLPGAATTAFSVGIAGGARAAIADNVAVALDAASGSLGTGSGWQVNNAAGYTAGNTDVLLDTGAGSLVPGNFLHVAGTRALIASVSTSGPAGGAIRLATPLVTAVTDNTPVIVESLEWSGYAHLATSVPTFPAENSTTPWPGADAYFFDSRRANGNVGLSSNVSSGAFRSGTNYVPRAIAKIDFDMNVFKLMVARSVSVATSASGYRTQLPDASIWSNSIFNPSGTATTLDLGLDDPGAAGLAYTVLPPSSGGTLAERMRPDPFRMYYAPADPEAVATIAAMFDDPRAFLVPASALYDGTVPDAWFDGLAVYLNSLDAEVRARSSGVPNRVDSGVRLINGRGPVASFSAAGKTGFTFATNDAAYILGHFNADGSVNLTTTAAGNGGYSARYPDVAGERLCAVMADAITLLSQPVFTTATTPYSQTNGWNDALSAFRITSTTWSSTWRSSQPSTSNNYEGIGTSATAIRAGRMPTSSLPGTAGSTWQSKLPPPAATEVSTGLLVGIVPSNHNATGLSDGPPSTSANGQYSGGAHNFPRLIEDWHCDMGSGTTADLVIRGSMVALFESRVAMEPWNIRTYQAPERFWGLHEGFRTANHDVPLEPIVLACSRKRYLEQTAAEYAAKKAEIEALPH